MKLSLGTAQFGLDYGISNNSGKTTLEEAGRILELALSKGLKFIDTAPFYGDSEIVLGQLLSSPCNLSIVTKVQKIGKNSISNKDVDVLEEVFFRSLENLRQQSVYGLLMHHPEDLLAENGLKIFEIITSLRNKGIVQKIGISAYSKEQIEKVLSVYNNIDLIQVPVNILDQRLLRDGYLKGLRRRGIEIHSRSAFLQGLLLMNANELTQFPLTFRNHLKKTQDYMKSQYESVLQACLAFVLENEDVDAVVCGVNTMSQLEEIIQSTSSLKGMKNNFCDYAINDESILNPFNWSVS